MNFCVLFVFIFLFEIVSCFNLNKQLVPDSVEIIDGYNVKEGDYGFMVSVQIIYGHICGGSIYNRRTIITAAHCIDAYYNYYILAGVLDANNRTGGQYIKVASYVKHPDFINPKKGNDIALLFLETELVESELVRPIELPRVHLHAGEIATVLGWGSTEPNTTLSGSQNFLQKLDVRVVSVDFCESFYDPSKYDITENNICTGKKDFLGGVCNGDSGGPLLKMHRSYNPSYGFFWIWKLFGITSFGEPGCDHHKPDVYTNVFNFKDWIKDNAMPNDENDSNNLL